YPLCNIIRNRGAAWLHIIERRKAGVKIPPRVYPVSIKRGDTLLKHELRFKYHRVIRIVPVAARRYLLLFYVQLGQLIIIFLSLLFARGKYIGNTFEVHKAHGGMEFGI